MYNSRCLFYFFTVNALMAFQVANAQSKIFLNPGIFYNGTGFTEDVNGIGLIAGLEYMSANDHWFSIELRTKCGYYAFDDGTKWGTDKDGDPIPPKNRGEARLKYNLFSSQIGLVPKLHLHFGEPWSFFLENEFAIGLMIGEFKYKGYEKKKRFTEPIFSYNIGIGAEYDFEKWTLSASVSYSTLNFRSNIRKHQPADYQERIPNQNAPLLFSIVFRIPLK